MTRCGYKSPTLRGKLREARAWLREVRGMDEDAVWQKYGIEKDELEGDIWHDIHEMEMEADDAKYAIDDFWFDYHGGNLKEELERALEVREGVASGTAKACYDVWGEKKAVVLRKMDADIARLDKMIADGERADWRAETDAVGA